MSESTVPVFRSLVSGTPRLFWILQTAGWLGYFTLNALAALGYGKPLFYLWVSAGSAVAGFVVTALLRLGYRAVGGWPVRRMIVASTVLLVAATAIYAKACAEILFGVCATCRPASPAGYIAHFGTSLYVILSWSGFYFGIRFGRQLARERETALKATAMAHEAQLKMLRYQLNPHFLFNTLNAISTLILDDQNVTANRMVGALSGFLRHTLDSDPVQLVALGEELDALERYLGIEQLRFGERLRVRVEAGAEARRGRVPSLVLQPLIENSIKYAVAPRADGGTIEIGAQVRGDRLHILVRDDGPGLPPKTSCTGVGLANTRERLRVLYGARQHMGTRNLAPRGLEILLDLPFDPVPEGGAPR
ncbi:sensor histidine kinase [Dokdonella koreensis]|uniref:Sensor histidine kinase n=1 Tax=Dokdonella koreensis DS-123 TaxID=1300342 RepID=A0A160DRY4_9GAMM|nr:histidine kinase [Dokdonella koreensis]ANB16985.1 Sensor histidine kinase [Dokdonella koreensis DS-123]